MKRRGFKGSMGPAVWVGNCRTPACPWQAATDNRETVRQQCKDHRNAKGEAHYKFEVVRSYEFCIGGRDKVEV